MTGRDLSRGRGCVLATIGVVVVIIRGFPVTIDLVDCVGTGRRVVCFRAIGGRGVVALVFGAT